MDVPRGSCPGGVIALGVIVPRVVVLGVVVQGVVVLEPYIIPPFNTMVQYTIPFRVMALKCKIGPYLLFRTVSCPFKLFLMV